MLAHPEPSKIVMDFLAAMQARDLEKAQSVLADDFEMIFPGSPPMTALAELIDWAKDRYRFVKKTTEAVEAFQSGGVDIVYVRGTLFGEWPDSSPFEDIRFIDRFEVVDGKITRQSVWNDLAEFRAQ